MVSFYCEYCCNTMKKKQCQNHGCRPFKLYCVDCKITFHGMDYQKHNVCKSEAELTRGPFYKPKGKQQKPADQSNNIVDSQKQNQQNDSLNMKVQAQDDKETWKGWKNTIKNILKQEEGLKMKTKKIKKYVVRKYLDQNKDVEKEQAEEIFEEKIKYSKFQNDGKITSYIKQ